MKLITIILSLLISGFTYAGHHEEGEMSANLKSAKAAYAAFNSGDIAAWRAELTPDAAWVMQKGLPYEGTWVGAAEIEAQVLSKIAEMWNNFQVQPIAYYESGNTVFVHVQMTADGLEAEAVHMVTMEGGKFARFQAFENTGQMLAAAK